MLREFPEPVIVNTLHLPFSTPPRQERAEGFQEGKAAVDPRIRHLIAATVSSQPTHFTSVNFATKIVATISSGPEQRSFQARQAGFQPARLRV
jgi:hypothetical protein